MRKLTYKIIIIFSLITNHAVSEDSKIPVPNEIILEDGQSEKEKIKEINAARLYAAFWNTGEAKYAEQALSDEFVDRTLPEGREQGLKGPLQASRNFRSIVPDLKVKIEQLIISGDRAIVHLSFDGHFLGEFNGIKGKGQKVSFKGTDIYKINNGKIVENWHIEDNMTFIKQLGL